MPTLDYTPNQRNGRPMIVGVAGYKRSGKDAAISAISATAREGVLVTQWAGPVKFIARLMFGLDTKHVEGLDYDRDKAEPWLQDHSVRDVLRAIGMMGRRFDPDVWVNKAINNALRDARARRPQPHLILVSGTRFKNEAEVCDEVWWVRRPGFGSDGHASEVGLSSEDADVILENDSNLDTLRHRAINLAESRLSLWLNRG
ncbi:MAG: hypothetical protein ACPGVG_18200 [Mycobacterium sp.]